ncbi:Myosin light chain 5 [Manis javanica]|nr:Myosin light chain 5 [Manis javanica]
MLTPRHFVGSAKGLSYSSERFAHEIINAITFQLKSNESDIAFRKQEYPSRNKTNPKEDWMDKLYPEKKVNFTIVYIMNMTKHIFVQIAAQIETLTK